MISAEYQQLVKFLGQRFTGIDRRFDDVNRRFDEMEGRFTELRQDMLGHFAEIHRRFERLGQEYQAITQALHRIEAGLADARGRREIFDRTSQN